MSTSVKAANPAIVRVVNPTQNSVSLFPPKRGIARTNRYTPAVTNVEECTSADTGVGAAIAAGSQAEKGTWALLVMAVITNAITKKDLAEGPGALNTYSHPPLLAHRTIDVIKVTSPTRLVRAVNIPALSALGD